MMLNNLRTVISYGVANTTVSNVRNILGDSLNQVYNLKLSTLFASTTFIKPVIGNGTDPVDVTDYKLANEITDGILHSNLSVYHCLNEDPSSVLCRICGIIENTSNDPITIKEIGLVFTNANTNISDHVLLIRENVEPYILSPGECVQLTFSII